MSKANRPPPKDMYWFAHGGTETENPSSQRNTSQGEDDDTSGSPSWNISSDRKGSPDEPRGLLVTDGSTSSGPSSLERDDRLRIFDKRLAVEERRKQLWEAEQERNDAVLRKHMEREAALEARRNAQRSNISFAFGSSIPRNVEVLHANDGRDSDIMSRSFTASGLTQRGDDVMSKSMNASLSAPRGRRKNDLMPTVPYERTPPTRASTSSSTRKRSVSMTRLDQLALPRRHYVEANKANSSASSGASSMVKDNIRSPTRPLSSASENSGGSGRVPGTVNRRLRSAPRKPRPVSIAGTLPDHKQITNAKPLEGKVSPIKRSYTPSKRTSELSEPRKNVQTVPKSSTPKSAEKAKTGQRQSATPKSSTPKTGAPKPTVPKPTKQVENKTSSPKPTSKKTDTPKVKDKNSQPIKKKTDMVAAAPSVAEVKEKSDVERQNESIASQDGDVAAENEKNNAKRIISEEEAKAALAEKRRLAREQAEREAELERQRQEELRLQEEERLRQEEEEHRRMEEEQLRLLEEHRLLEEEKLRKAIEEQEQKEKEEKAKRDEELQMKAELERKAKEEAEKQRLELEEKLRKEEEERAERKKRLEKIMSRTRGKSSGTSPSGSVSGSDQLDSGEHAQEGFSSGANSLDSNEVAELPSEPISIEDHAIKAEVSSVGDSMEAHPTYEICSENESLNSNDLIMPTSETASQDNSLVIIPDKTDLPAESDQVPSAVSSEIKGSGEELASATEVHVTESAVSELETENQFSAVSENEESKLPQADKVEEKIEVSQPVKEIESVLTTETLEHAIEDAQMIESIQENLLPSEQQFSQNQDLVAKTDETVVSDVVVEEKIQMHYESQLDTKIESQEDKDSEEVVKHPNDEISNVSDVLDSQNEEFMLPEPSSMPSNLSFGMDGVDGKEPDLLEVNRDSSVSSDIKLPDPIYETSDEGSISSDKHQQFDHHDDFNYMANQDNTALEEVFAEQAVMSNIDSADQHSPTFLPDAYAEHQNPFSNDSSDYVVQSSMPSDNPFKSNIEEAGNCMSESMYEDKALDSLEQPREIEEENVIPSRSSTSSVIEADVHLHESELSKQNDVFYQDIQENKENLISEVITSCSSTEMTSQFVQDEMTTSVYDIYSNKENLISAPSTQQELEVEGTINVEPTKDNPFEKNPFSDCSELHTFQPQGDFFNTNQQQLCAASEQIGNFENQIVHDNEFSSQNEQANDVTVIKSDDNGAFVGIISSLDHDHSTNDFPKPNLHEQLKNNYECASITDSEENSSLDSNLSQIMTVENSEKDTVGGLNHTDKSTIESNSSKSAFSNGEQQNPFETDPFNNYDKNSKSNVNYYTAEISNGHSVESSKQVSDQLSELHNYGQLDGNDILSVDHSKNNIFENVDAIDYDKVSPDPFLAKGNAKQISGNPFLLQDDQKQVLMTPDFLN
ncbi:reticulocyte-binding protein 2-like protein a [Trichonephila inaurata madagascariensis]|uniref:Reticulocyte-binding protein 2-like protein a n=1 Tax=Trichonephila inaurata madagascariensis TaxID=2747483 RepID=A0A8X6XIG8_9ARAC|nr:reticulocyte-binding protein 2-like protein a [Trichonephila inaurata madagascariensis]